MSIESAVLTLPTITAFVDAVVNTVRSHSVVVLVPDTVSRDMVARLISNRLEVLRLPFRDVPFETDNGPVISVAQNLNVNWPSLSTPRSVRNLLRHLGFTDVVHVRNFDPENASNGTIRKRWMEFLLEWVRERRELESRFNRSVPKLCIVAKLKDFDYTLQADEQGLKALWWHGLPSSLELRLACRIASQEEGVDEDRQRWREQVLPAFVACDVNLAEYMWDDILSSQESMTNSLIEYGLKVGLTDCMEAALDFMKRGINGTDPVVERGPARDYWRLWSRGGIVSTPEYGAEIHPSLLALLGCNSAIEHRLWRGQAEYLLPLLNDIRMRVCDDLTQAFGPSWPQDPSPPKTSYETEAVKDDPRGVELGRLEFLLKNVPAFRARKKLLPIVSQSRMLRNEIAHYRPVSFTDVGTLWKAVRLQGWTSRGAERLV